MRRAAFGRGDGRRELLARLGLVAVALAVVWALAELAARLFLGNFASRDQFLAYATVQQLEARPAEQRWMVPHRYLGYVPGPGYRDGANHHNSLGLRGEEIAPVAPPGVYRIVCLGGSTTYSTPVEDPADAYPARLEEALHRIGHRQVEVVNAGVPGYGSLESLLYFELKILDLEPDLILVTHAANDVHARLVWPPQAYQGDNSGWRNARPLERQPAILEHSMALRMLWIRMGWLPSFRSMESVFRPDAATSFTGRFHTQVMAGSYPEGPFEEVPIARMLEENRPVYLARHLRNLIAVASTHGIDVALVTFPYHPSWPGKAPVADPAYRAALAGSNQVVRQIAAASEAYGFDLAARIPADEQLYTDGYHFTREGNELRARYLAERIVEHPLLERIESPR